MNAVRVRPDLDAPQQPVSLKPEPGWRAFGTMQADLLRPFLTGDSDRLTIQYWADAANDLVAKVRFGAGSEGPPGHAHGGSIATVLDELMGGACWLRGFSALAGTLTVRYRKPVYLGLVGVAHSRVLGIEGRRILTASTLYGEDGALYAEAEGTYVIVPALAIGPVVAAEVA